MKIIVLVVVFATNTINKNMTIQKNKSFRMSGPEKDQWATIILIRAYTGVWDDHNHLQSEILSISHL